MDKRIIKELVNKQNPTIFEIGCADGQDTIDFINTFGELNIHCFEPEPKNINIVKSTINYNKHYLFEGVVSNKNGEVIFNRSNTDNPEQLSYSGSIKEPKEHLNEWPGIRFDESIKVNSITLDKYCENNCIEIIDFIWADVQGAEEDMILGGLNTFKNKVRFLYTEYSNKEYYVGQINLERLTKFMGDDWEVIHDFGTDVLLRNKNL